METLLEKVKSNLILTHGADDALLERLIASAVSYAESFQHLDDNFYHQNEMPQATEQAVIMLTSHFYESRDGSTAGFFADSVPASRQVWETVNNLLRMNRRWQV